MHNWEEGAQMFFKQIRRNAASNRKDNGLFFGSLIIAIIAFYTLLSIGEQDVMRFLKSVESNAVEKLMLLIPPCLRRFPVLRIFPDLFCLSLPIE